MKPDAKGLGGEILRIASLGLEIVASTINALQLLYGKAFSHASGSVNSRLSTISMQIRVPLSVETTYNSPHASTTHMQADCYRGEGRGSVLRRVANKKCKRYTICTDTCVRVCAASAYAHEYTTGDIKNRKMSLRKTLDGSKGKRGRHRGGQAYSPSTEMCGRRVVLASTRGYAAG